MPVIPAKIRSSLKLIFWVLLVQLILVNISAALYAHKFTHFYDAPGPGVTSANVLSKTWKLFVGPKFYKQVAGPQPSFPCDSVTLRTPDGISVAGLYAGSDTSRGCILLFHGVMVNKSYLLDEAAVFRKWGYNVLLVDFRAHGASSGNNSTFGVSETAEVVEAVKYARSRGNRKVILYGVSLGAVVSLRAVARGEVQPDAVIADMPFGSLQEHLKARARVLGFPAQPFGFLVTGWMGLERGYNGYSHKTTRYAKNVSCPVLLQWGERDEYVSRGEVEAVYSALAARHKKLVTYDAGHESFLRLDPVSWQQEVASFLQSLPG